MFLVIYFAIAQPQIVLEPWTACVFMIKPFVYNENSLFHTIVSKI